MGGHSLWLRPSDFIRFIPSILSTPSTLSPPPFDSWFTPLPRHNRANKVLAAPQKRGKIPVMLEQTHHGKIARLPRNLCHELNQRLADGEPSDALLAWLNAQPEVQTVLAAHFSGNPISPQNLTNWRQGGYEETLCPAGPCVANAGLRDRGFVVASPALQYQTRPPSSHPPGHPRFHPIKANQGQSRPIKANQGKSR